MVFLEVSFTVTDQKGKDCIYYVPTSKDSIFI